MSWSKESCGRMGWEIILNRLIFFLFPYNPQGSLKYSENKKKNQLMQNYVKQINETGFCTGNNFILLLTILRPSLSSNVFCNSEMSAPVHKYFGHHFVCLETVL